MRSRLIVVVAAVALGLAAAFLTMQYLQAQQTSIARGAQLVNVLVAAQDLPAGMTAEELLSRGTLTQRSIPRQYVSASAVSSRAALDGKVVARPISKDEQVTSAMFKYPAEVGLASSTPKDYVAVSIPYDAARGVGGLLRPGDSVAVFASFTPGGKAVEQAITKLILTKVKVLAVGVALTADAADAQASGSSGQGGGTLVGSGSQQRSSTITLALTPSDAEKLIFAEEQGSVWLALFSPTDPSTPVTPGARLVQMVR
jgi:pilus assembly protein CpaB